MRVDNNQIMISFGYKSPLKTLYLKNKMPSVKYGFYGDKLTKANVSLEHLIPHSKGGSSHLDNFVLASKHKNQLRGNQDIRNFATMDNVVRYLSQFIDLKIDDFNGNSYIQKVVKTLKKLGVINEENFKLF